METDALQQAARSLVQGGGGAGAGAGFGVEPAWPGVGGLEGSQSANAAGELQVRLTAVITAVEQAITDLSSGLGSTATDYDAVDAEVHGGLSGLDWVV